MPSETSTPCLSPEAALALLPLPDFDGLSDEQKRGVACVWRGTPLTNLTAIDLGERPDAAGYPWFPRSDRQGVLSAALATLQQHSQSCEQCADNYRGCQDGYRLVRLVRVTRG